MTEQMGTPGSNADTSINGKAGAPKDKACPFCHQQFTSSSLGRHLDLYIKPKNPKPQDGIHEVDEIRKMRGGITRRQPRGSLSKREGSTPGGTPSATDRRSPGPDSGREVRSPSVRKDEEQAERPPVRKSGWHVNMPTWESTGVMNVIPNVKNGESSRSGDDNERDGSRKVENRQRSVSKQMYVKTTFEQKQKMMEALDNAKAAELALREILGAVRAAKNRVDGPPVFDYDPLTLDFPSLCLRCLPPPPTLYQTIPITTPSSWSIQPPDDQQYQALREHFSKEFNRFRVACQIGRVPMDNMSYPPSEAFESLDDAAEMTARVEAEANESESRISAHLHAVYGQWNSLPQSRRQEIWMLEMARGIGRKSEEISKLKKELEFSHQETAHLKLQIDELNRLQHPREFRLVSPTTMPISGDLMYRLSEFVTTRKSVGFDIADKHMHLDTMIERAIERWKGVVKEARSSGNGLAAQRSLSGESAPSTASINPPTIHTPITPIPTPQIKKTQIDDRNFGVPQNSQPVPVSQAPIQTNMIDLGSDIDADADADMEDDDSYMEMSSHSMNQPTMAQNTGFRLANGGGGGGGQGSRLEAPMVQNGYVRIGA